MLVSVSAYTDEDSIVTHMGDLYNIFEVDPSLETGKKMWQCFFGCFDTQTGWAVKLEKMWMEKKKMGYRYNISVYALITIHLFLIYISFFFVIQQPMFTYCTK
jgi:hypothetical protein